MVRIAVALSTLALVATALAGCLGQSSTPVQPAASPPPGIPAVPDVLAEGAEILKHADAVELIWKGEAGFAAPPSPAGVPFVGTPSGLVNARIAPPKDHAFELPKEITVAEATLTWASADTDLNLALRGDKGSTQCRSAGFNDEKTKEYCKVFKVGKRAEVEEWAARVSIVSNAAGLQAPVPYELHVNLSVLPFKVLGPALDPAQRSAQLSFADLRIDEEHKTGEPSIKVDDQGTVYIAAPTGLMQSLWKSTDGGQSFEWIDIMKNTDATDIPGQAWGTAGRGGGDGDVFVTPDGKELYFADLWGCQSVGRSMDQGKSWHVNPLSCDLPLTDRQWLWAQPGGHVWFAFNGILGATVMHSLDGGATWLNRGYVVEDDCARGNVVVDKDQRIYLAGCNDQGPGVGVSEDGMTYTWHPVAKRSGEPLAGFCYVCGIFTVIDLDDAGNAYVVWADPSDQEDAFSVWFSSSQDKGKTWSEPVRVNTAPGNALLPWIAAKEPGHVAVAWYQTQAMGSPDKVDGEWYVHYAESTNALDATPTFAENLAWEQPVQYGPVCITGSACQGARNLLDFLMVDIDAQGLGHLAFIDGTHGGSPGNSFVMYAKQLSGLSARDGVANVLAKERPHDARGGVQ